MAPIQGKCEAKENIRKVTSKHTTRIKEHNIRINRTKQIQKKVDDASKALIQVEFKEDNVKIKLEAFFELFYFHVFNKQSYSTWM